jgi:hypothetical protein
MVLSTELGIRLDGLYCLWEDVHVITEDGHEQLTAETDELREIPFRLSARRGAGPRRWR